MKFIKFFTLMIGILLLWSCKTVPVTKDESIYVMVYDYNNTGIKDVSVSLDGFEIGKTDVYGRFVYPYSLSEKKIHEIYIKKAGFESISETIKNINGDLVLYYKLYDANTYARLAEENLDNEKIDSALNYIDKAVQIESREDYLFFKAIVLHKLNREDELKNLLEKIQNTKYKSYLMKHTE